MASHRRKRTRTRKHEPVRTRIVWGALVASMTAVGGLMWVLQGGGAPRLDGRALPALVSAAGPSSIESVLQTRAPLDRARWTSIVIHHSGSVVGSPEAIEAQHRSMNLAGLGYHFVIGNGRGMENGEVHVGYRWLDQLPGAHVAGPAGGALNHTSIGVCVVGDGRRREFTDAQIDRLAELVATLSRRFEIPADRILLHSDVASVEDPGRLFPRAALHERLSALR